MAYRNYNRGLFVRITSVVLCAFLTGFVVHSKTNYYLVVLLVFVTVLATYYLITFANKTNQQISYFIQAIKNDDTTLRFPRKTGNKIIDELHASLNELNLVLQETKIKSQLKERYFEEILDNIGTGIIVYNSQGFVVNINPAALHLLGLKTLTHIIQFDKYDSDFRKQLQEMHHNDKRLLNYSRKTDKMQLVTRSSSIQLKDETANLITFENIQGELERKEIDSWVQLIRVLSHEIMNSLTPVTSIAQSLKSMWKDKITKDQKSKVESTIGGLDVISDRGQALIRFVNSYRKLTRIPTPRIENHLIHNVIDSLSILVSNFREDDKVEINFIYDGDSFELAVDLEMMTQVIINLVKNAVEAGKINEQTKIDVQFAQSKSGQTTIKVSDNGPGIDKEIVDQVFVPFFSTKEGGSGVGLSHSRQIIRAHGGSIKCKSEKGRTEFIIELQ